MTAFGNDTGAAEPAVRSALRAAVASYDGAPAAAEAAEVALLRALPGARFLLPVLPAPLAVAQAWAADTHHHEHDQHAGHDQDASRSKGKATPMAAVRLVAPDGRQGMPVFTGLDALTAWDASARPLPMTAADTSRMAIEEGCDVLIADLGQPHGYVLRSSMVWALAEERAWLPACRDPVVCAAVETASSRLDGVVAAGVGASAAADEPGTLVVELVLERGLGPERIEAAATALGERLAADAMVRCRLDAVRFVVRRA